MNKRKTFEGKTTRLSSQTKEVDQNKINFIKDSFTTKNKEFKRSTFTLTTSDIDWLDQIVKELNAKFAEKLNFRSVGPLPAYSFYTLEIKKMQFEEVDWARKKLGLSEAATKEEIAKAHKLKALSTHPDRNSNLPDIENKFDEVTKAYEALLDYCQEHSCSFREEDFRKNSLIVKVRQ